MKKTTNKVAKSLTPEEKTILGNIRSLVEQLGEEELGNEEEIVEEEVVEEAADEEEVGECEEEEAEVQKSAAPDEVANNDAQQRIEAEDTDINEALKIVKSYLSKHQVRKSVNPNAQVAKAMVAMAKRLDDMQSTLDGITEGIRQAPVRKSTQAAAQFDVDKASLSDVMQTLFAK